jgi:hypothetical protein
MEFHQINDPAGRPHEEIGAEERELEPIDTSEALLCANCGHTKEAHWDRYGCQIEGPDRWVEGDNCGGWVAEGPCCCMDFKAEEAEPLLEQDRRSSGSFGEAQARLARALDDFSERLMLHLEAK